MWVTLLRTRWPYLRFYFKNCFPTFSNSNLHRISLADLALPVWTPMHHQRPAIPDKSKILLPLSSHLGVETPEWLPAFRTQRADNLALHFPWRGQTRGHHLPDSHQFFPSSCLSRSSLLCILQGGLFHSWGRSTATLMWGGGVCAARARSGAQSTVGWRV